MSLTDDWSAQLRSAEFDRLVSGLHSWVETAPAWPPLDRARALWSRISPRLDKLRLDLDRVLVVGVVGGTGTGKSTLLNALLGERACEASDVQRPTTRRPLVLANPDIDTSILELDEWRTEVKRLTIPLLQQMILIDCPDPDTQCRDGADQEPGTHHSAADAIDSGVHSLGYNRNLEMLRGILPLCDVLLCTGTAQKYKTQAVADELLRHAPGRQAVFVQTHADKDADISADWQRHLESQGFQVPQMFRIDSEAALTQIEQHRPVPPEFARLKDFLNTELAGRARHRILRANALDLLDWFLGQVQRYLTASLPALTILEEAVAAERARLFDGIRQRLGEQLRGHQGVWRARLLREVTLRWSWGPFASFLRLLDSARGWMYFVPALLARSVWSKIALSGIGAGKGVADWLRESRAEGSWLAMDDMGIGPGDLAQSNSILSGFASDAGINANTATRSPREAVDEKTLASAVQHLYQRVDADISRAINQRVSRRAGSASHGLLELLFVALPAVLLWRLAKDFFYEHLWLQSSQPLLGLDFLIQSALWVLMWGLLLRGLLAWRLQRGLKRDLSQLINQLTPESALRPLFGELAASVATIRQHTAHLNQWRDELDQLRADLKSASPWQLSSLATDSDSRQINANYKAADFFSHAPSNR